MTTTLAVRKSRGGPIRRLRAFLAAPPDPFLVSSRAQQRVAELVLAAGDQATIFNVGAGYTDLGANVINIDIFDWPAPVSCMRIDGEDRAANSRPIEVLEICVQQTLSAARTQRFDDVHHVQLTIDLRSHDLGLQISLASIRRSNRRKKL